MNKKIFKRFATGALAGVISLGFAVSAGAQTLSTKSVPDISEWQNKLTKSTATALKGEAGGVILRVGYGANYRDRNLTANLAAVKAAKLSYGVYQFSRYISVADAKAEARKAYERAPKANFYVNDAEQLTASKSTYIAATKAWAKEMRKLTKKPIVLYSYRSFYNSYIQDKSNYNAFWLAGYSSYQPTPQNYHMWQYADNHYFVSLKQATDASRVVISKKSFNYFFGGSTAVDTSKYTVGGYKVGNKVYIHKGSKFYDTKVKVDTSITKTPLTVKQVRKINTGKSNQVLTLYNGKAVVGLVRAQDVSKKVKLSVDGIVGTNTVYKLEQTMGHTVNGIIGGQYKGNTKYLLAFNKGTIGYSNKGSNDVKYIQKKLGMKGKAVDGYFGKKTIKLWQKKLGVKADGYFGADSAKALQKALNNGKIVK